MIEAADYFSSLCLKQEANHCMPSCCALPHEWCWKTSESCTITTAHAHSLAYVVVIAKILDVEHGGDKSLKALLQNSWYWIDYISCRSETHLRVMSDLQLLFLTSCVWRMQHWYALTWGHVETIGGLEALWQLKEWIPVKCSGGLKSPESSVDSTAIYESYGAGDIKLSRRRKTPNKEEKEHYGINFKRLDRSCSICSESWQAGKLKVLHDGVEVCPVIQPGSSHIFEIGLLSEPLMGIHCHAIDS